MLNDKKINKYFRRKIVKDNNIKLMNHENIEITDNHNEFKKLENDYDKNWFQRRILKKNRNIEHKKTLCVNDNV